MSSAYAYYNRLREMGRVGHHSFAYGRLCGKGFQARFSNWDDREFATWRYGVIALYPPIFRLSLLGRQRVPDATPIADVEDALSVALFGYIPLGARVDQSKHFLVYWDRAESGSVNWLVRTLNDLQRVQFVLDSS